MLRKDTRRQQRKRGCASRPDRCARMRTGCQRTRAQQRTHAVPHPSVPTAQLSALVDHPWMDPQVMRRWRFNVDMEYHAQEHAFMNMASPSEWMSGMPIPSDYRMFETASDDDGESREDDLNDK